MLKSEQVVVQSPLSFTGSAKRLWRPMHHDVTPTKKVFIGVALATLILMVWMVVAAWYLMVGLLVVPWRLMRRHSRREKQARLRHRELAGR